MATLFLSRARRISVEDVEIYMGGIIYAEPRHTVPRKHALSSGANTCEEGFSLFSTGFKIIKIVLL